MADEEIEIPITVEEPVEDPVVMYLIIREDLKMSTGKIAAQVSHATKLFLLQYFKLEVFRAALKHRPDHILTKEEEEHIQLTHKWIEGRSTTITKRADNKEWEKLKALFGRDCFVVHDAGLTEVPAGSETVMSLWPRYRSLTPKLVWRLRNL